MKKGLNLTLSVLFLFFLSAYLFSHKTFLEYRADPTKPLRAIAPPFSPEVMAALAGEFKGIVADYLLLEAAAFIGSNIEPTPEDWEAISLLFKQTMALDPHFRQSYYLVQSTLPWEAEEYDLAIELLRKSKQHRPWDWVPGFFIGFAYFYFLKDNLRASKYLMGASRVPDAPIGLATFAARLAQKAGQTQTAIAFLRAMYEKTDDQDIRRTLEERIKAHTGVLILEKGVEEFNKRFGRPPNVLEELVTRRILEKLPQNPYNKLYTYENGLIGF